MSDFAKDLENERQRYNQRFGQQLQIERDHIGPDGAEAVALSLRRPYLFYEACIRQAVNPGTRILDLCCGDGTHSFIGARQGALVTASDIAENSLALVRLRAERAGFPVETVIANAEKLPFPDQSFDMVTCAGGLSYVDIVILLDEVGRVLRPGGSIVFIDSFNHNPIYRLNRYRHYLFGNRTYSTLLRMPDRSTLTCIRTHFPDLKVDYFGIGSFLSPFIRLITSEQQAARFNDWLDRILPFARSWSFKIVLQGQLPTVKCPHSAKPGAGLTALSKQNSMSCPAETMTEDSSHGATAVPKPSLYKLFRLQSGSSALALGPVGWDEEYLYPHATYSILRLFKKKGIIIITLKWWLYCLFYGHPTFPRIYIAYAPSSRRPVHYSFILPPLGRFLGPRREDIEIGPCWTEPEYRGRGYFSRAIRKISQDYRKDRRNLFMLSRQANLASSSVIRSAGFILYYQCLRYRNWTKMFHRYRIIHTEIS